MNNLHLAESPSLLTLGSPTASPRDGAVTSSQSANKLPAVAMRGSSLGGEMEMKCMVHNDQKIKQLKDFRRRRSKEEIVTELLKEDLSEDVT